MPVSDLTIDDLDLDAAKRWFTGVRELYDKELVTLRLLISHAGKTRPDEWRNASLWKEA